MPGDRLRIVHVITKLELGGAQQNTLYTVSHLNRELFEPHLVTGKGGLLDQDALNVPNLTVHFCPHLVREIQPFADIRAFLFLKRLFEQLRPQIVHTHSSKAGILGRLAAHAAGVPNIIHTYHGFGFHRFQNPLLFRLYVRAEKIACKYTQHLVFVGKDNWKWAEELQLGNGCSASLIRSGVETERFLNSARNNLLKKELLIPEAGKVVGMIACLKPQKDPITYVEAADQVMQQIPNAYFLLIGDGDLKNEVNRKIAKLSHPDRFICLGWRRDPDQLLPILNLLVLTSLWEGVPRVVPEATLAGIPVIATDIEGTREVVFEGKNGTLVQPGNWRALAEKIAEALQHEWKVDSQLQKEIQQEFSIEEMVKKQERLYLSLLPSPKK
jgi:glycosyltransferase involved in cell wall biosynthesis